MKKKQFIIIALVLVMFVSGCTPSNNNLVGPDTGGIWQSLIKISSWVVIWFSRLFDNNLIFGVTGLAIAFNILLLPMTLQQQRYSQKISELTPKIQKIQQKYAKYPKDDAIAQQQMSMEIMTLYTKNKINPMAGCLPMLIQFPLLIAVYGGVTNLIYFTQTLTDPNGTVIAVIHGLDLFNATDLHAQMFGIDFAMKALSNPVLIFLPVISGLLSFISIKISNIGVDTAGNPSMGLMTVISPLMSVFIGLTLPGIISIYWIVGTLFRLIITLWFKRHAIKQMLDRKKIQKTTV